MGKRHSPKKHLLPFFDHLDHPEFHHFSSGLEVDITPPPSHLAPFDRDVLQRIQAAVDGEIFPGRNTTSDFKLTRQCSLRKTMQLLLFIRM
jgi:hypothetical protein